MKNLATAVILMVLMVMAPLTSSANDRQVIKDLMVEKGELIVQSVECEIASIEMAEEFHNYRLSILVAFNENNKNKKTKASYEEKIAEAKKSIAELQVSKKNKFYYLDRAKKNLQEVIDSPTE